MTGYPIIYSASDIMTISLTSNELNQSAGFSALVEVVPGMILTFDSYDIY